MLGIKNHMILSEIQGYRMKIADAIFLVTAYGRRAAGYEYYK